MCPPPPTVASICRLPGAGARVSEDLGRHHRHVPFLHLSSTGRLRIPGGPWKRMWCDVRSPGRRSPRRRRSGPRGAWLYSSQRGGRPDLGVVPAAEDERLALEPRERPEALRDEDATLAVELRLEGPGEQLPLEQPRVGIGHGQAPDLRRELLPGRHREDRETGVEPPRDHAAAVELRAEASRDGEPPLLVDRMPVLAGEHRVPSLP